MRALAEALRFLSVIPVPGKPPKRFDRVLAAYPWAGLILGLLTALGVWLVSPILGVAGCAVTAVVLRIALTGGLHLDGVADLADGLGGGRDVERRLEIMKDSRLGSFGALALICLVAVQGVLIAELLTGPWSGMPRVLAEFFRRSGTAFDTQALRQGEAAAIGIIGGEDFWPPEAGLRGMYSWRILLPLVAAPVISRGVLPVFMRIFPSARPGGLGDMVRKSASTGVIVFCLISAAGIVLFLLGLPGLAALGAGLLVMALVSRRVSRQLGGLTGDGYGRLIELGDAAALLAMLAMMRLGF